MTASLDRRRAFLDVDWKTLASFCAVLVFLGTIIGVLAKQSEAATNALQDKNIAVLGTRIDNMEAQFANINTNNRDMKAELDQLLIDRGYNPITVVAKEQK